MMKTAKRPSDKTIARSKLGAYSNLTPEKTRKLAASDRAKASSKGPKLRPLPKEQPARFFAHFRWERIRAYWFSKAGLKRVGKIFAACFLLGIIGVGALFVYYKSQLRDIQLNDLTISDTVNVYLDRNGVVLWEDKGDADYRLVVNEDEISTYVRQATVAIEDRSFYTHPGVDISALLRAVLSTVTGQGVQGGSTLTQQLIKQIYFSDEAASQNRGGIARKIKELILSIELEKMYSKEQIITMYLNESPYGGRRNGIESAARTYFGKSAKELNLAESALLAAIPNNPAILNPYYEPGNEMLIARQHKTLDVMAEMGYITSEESAAAKEVPILDQILPESNQYADIKAPHFVMEVRKQLEEKYGMQAMRTGGYTITTTLDYRAQEMAEAAIAEGAKLRYMNNSDNLALASVDVETGQVIAMVGSVDWNTPIYGEVNATTANLEPGSSIKPLLDYVPLFSLTGDNVYGPGTVWRDENIDHIYCAGYTGSCALRNFSGRFYGNVSLRQSLAGSLNINAVKALSVVGIDKALEILHGLGDKSYCADNNMAGLSMAIGSGCTVKMVEHANAYASIARGGTYKELTYVLDIKDSNGKSIDTWHDSAPERIIDEQVAYEISSILSDADARRITFGSEATAFGFVVPGVWTASKTGTTTTSDSSVSKDSWLASYSTAVATTVWNGNHDGSGLSVTTNAITRTVVNNYMENVHKNLYQQEGKWKPGDQPVRPAGIQELSVNGRKDIWPSWYNNKNSVVTEKVEFNKDTKLRANDCTPADKRIEIEVVRTKDPVSGTEIMSLPDGYHYDEFDVCQTVTTTIRFNHHTEDGPGEEWLGITIEEGSTVALVSYTITVDGKDIETGIFTPEIRENGLRYDIKGDESQLVIEVTDSSGKKYSRVFTDF